MKLENSPGLQGAKCLVRIIRIAHYGAMKALTERQHMILTGLIQGLPVAEIADRLSLSKATVYRSLQDAGYRLEKETTVTIVTRALKLGWIDPDLRLSPEGRIVRSISAAVRR